MIFSERGTGAYLSTSLNDFGVTVFEVFLLPACQCSSFQPMKIGFIFSVSFIYSVFGRPTFPKLAQVQVQLNRRWVVQNVGSFFSGQRLWKTGGSLGADASKFRNVISTRLFPEEGGLYVNRSYA
jgi:hypothetical protein